MLRVDPPIPAVQLQSLPAFQTLGPLQNPGKPDNTFPDIVQEADKAPVLRKACWFSITLLPLTCSTSIIISICLGAATLHPNKTKSSSSLLGDLRQCN